MNGLEIIKVLSPIPGHTVGVYPADQIPQVWTKPTAYIFNTEGHKQGGMHWVSIYVSKSGDAWYFDSFGLPPIIPEYMNRIRRNCKTLRWNSKQLQSDDSDVCGQYCIVFLHYMTTGLGIKRFLRNFSSDRRKNDAFVANYVAKIQGLTA